MANLNIKFNNKNFSIDPASLADATARLEAHLTAMMDEPDAPEERLEGDGAEFYTLAPTALSFRSTAPLNELQEIQINGVTVDPANYTLEEGSTIVTFPIDYLKTLNVGSYEVDVVSNSKSVKGGFSVVEPELNEHGFYYNQPYTAFVEVFGENESFFIRDDGTLYVVGTPSGDVSQCTYTCSGNSMTVVSPVIGTLTATVSDDGTEIFCNELQIAFTLGNESIVADGDYIYIYKEDLGGYEVNAIDTTKAEYGAIKTGINGIDTVALVNFLFQNNKSLVNAPTIPTTVTTIGSHAFDGCSALTEIVIPASVIALDNSVFFGCDSLINILVDENNATYKSIDGNLYSEDRSMLIWYARGKAATIFEIPKGVTVIGNQAFIYHTTLTSIKFPDSLATIEFSAFNGCTILENITFEGSTAQWNAITKSPGWNLNVPATYVQCTDGQVTL